LPPVAGAAGGGPGTIVAQGAGAACVVMGMALVDSALADKAPDITGIMGPMLGGGPGKLWLLLLPDNGASCPGVPTCRNICGVLTGVPGCCG